MATTTPHTIHKTFTLLLLCWNPGKESPIHDHPCDGCVCQHERAYKYLAWFGLRLRYTLHSYKHDCSPTNTSDAG